MVKMSTFGNLLRRYEGSGSFYRHDPNDGVFKCDFEAAQFKDGAVIIICTVLSNEGRADNPPLGSDLLHLIGSTRDGARLEVEGEAILSRSTSNFNLGTMQLTFILSGSGRLRVGQLSWQNQAEARFGLTNLEYLGTESQQVSETQRRRGLLPLEINNVKIALHKVPDYEERVEILKTQAGIDVTCEARLNVYDPSSFEESRRVIDNLCKLLTIATGTLISWICVDVVSEHNSVLFTEHHPAVTRRYTGAALIDPRKPGDLKLFIESTYLRYTELEPTYQLSKAISAYVDARASGFLETRALVLTTLVDYLTGILANKEGKTLILPADQFESKFDELCKRIAAQIKETFPNMAMEQVRSMAVKSKGFNYRAYKNKLRLLKRRFKIPLREEEIDDFGESRNHLVHYMRFQSNDPFEFRLEFRRMLHLLDRILLSMLGYEGYYLNACTFEREALHRK